MDLFKKMYKPWQKIRSSKTSKRRQMDKCNCTNCHKLPERASECDVCMNPLQGTKIRSCPVCANLVCENCASKLTKCAFCRSEKPLERNRAVERLLENLHLPCKNFRYDLLFKLFNFELNLKKIDFLKWIFQMLFEYWQQILFLVFGTDRRSGCKLLLSTESRSDHEKFCYLSSYECILDETCRWSGPIMSMPSHFRQAHNLCITNGKLFTFDIDQFQQKALSETGTQYMVSITHRQKKQKKLYWFNLINFFEY